MKEVKFYKYATVSLIALNFLIIAFFIFNRPKHQNLGQPNELKNRAAQMLELDENQEVAFYKLVEVHQQEMESLNMLQKQMLESFFEKTANDSSYDHSEQLEELSEIEMLKVESTLNHFESIKAILRSEQLDDFDQFKKRALNQILGGSGKREQGPPPPHH